MVVLQYKTVKARKDHPCFWCGEKINAGAECNYSAGIFEGDFYSGWMHLECENALGKSDRDGYEEQGYKRGKTAEESEELLRTQP